VSQIPGQSISTIDTFLENLRLRYNLQGLLLHGSLGKDVADEWSDIDLIGVTKDGPPKKQNRHLAFDGRSVDLCLAPPHIIRLSFESANATNNNFFLNTFTVGRCVYDDTGIMASLTEAAAKVRARGPTKISLREYLDNLRHLEKAVRQYRINCLRAGEKRLHSRIPFIVSSQVYQKLTTSYARAAQLWTSSPRETLQFFEAAAPEFHEVCIGYLRADSDQERVAAMEAMLTAFRGLEARLAPKCG